MPSCDPSMLDHEWTKHGTCSGLAMADYFVAIKTAAEKVIIPEELRQPSQPITKDFSGIAALFKNANPGMQPEMMSISVGSDGNVSEVRICFDKRLDLMKCPGHPRQGGGRFLPVR